MAAKRIKKKRPGPIKKPPKRSPPRRRKRVKKNPRAQPRQPKYIHDRVTDYALRVAAGKIIANLDVTATCKRHLSDLKRKDIYFDVDAARRVIDFFESILRLNGGQFEGLPFTLHESQAFILGSLFGWKKPSGERRFRRAYLEISKGNGKTPMAAGVGLYALVADNEARAEIYTAAAQLEQAMVLFRDARAMVQLSSGLDEICSITGGDNKPNISYLDTASFFRPISNERGKSGPRPSVAICDELHEHPDKTTLEMLERGFKWRRQPLLLMITNSGFDKSTVCWDEHDYAIKVAHGDIKDDNTFSYVCGLDEGDDPFKDEKCWVKANPLLDVTITREYLRNVVKQAKDMPSKRNTTLRLHFCKWTSAASAWISREKWEGCEVMSLTKIPERLCYGGLDLSSRNDLTAAAVVWVNPDGTFDAELHFWTPEDTLQARSERDRVPYPQWKNEGYINATPGSSIDLEYVALKLGSLHQENDFKKVAFDRWGMKYLEKELDSAGITLPLEPHGQGFQDMAPAVANIENKILNGKLKVKYNPCLRWNVASAVTLEDPAGGKKFAKNKSTGRIDGLVALAMALRLAALDDSGNVDEFYNNPIRAKMG